MSEFIAILFAISVAMPIAIFAWGKYQRMFDAVWSIDSAKDRGAEIERIKGMSVSIGIYLGCGWVFMVIVSACIYDWFIK